MTLLQMSLSGALMILVIAGIRFFLQRKVHRNVWLFLWFTAVLRLLIPFSLPAATSFYNLPLFQAAQAVPQALQPAEGVGAATIPASPSVDFTTVVWLIGAALILLIVISNHIYHLRRYRFSLPCTASLPPMPKGVTVRMLEGLDAPLTYGIVKPTILLPYNFPTEDQTRLCHVLQHDLSHIRNRDILMKLLLIVTAGIHWFNPLAWLMVYLANQDMEMRCDAQAVSSSDNERIAYARSLIATEEDRLYSYLQVGFAHSSTEQRIRALTKDRAVPVWSIVVCVVALLLLGAVFMTGQAKATPAEVPPSTPTEEMQNTTPEVTPEQKEKEIEIFADEPEELPEETEETTVEEVLPEEPVTEESVETQTEEPIVEEEVTTGSEPVTQTQSTYTAPASGAYTVPISEIVHPTIKEEPFGNYPVDLSPPPNYNAGQPEFPVVVLPDPTPKINYPVRGENVPGHYPSLPGY